MKPGVLVVAAHPDDEVLGCGGTIARHAADGHPVTILILGEGATSRGASGPGPSDQTRALARQAEAAGRLLGASAVRFGTFPDNRFDTVPLLDIVRVIEAVKTEAAPGIVYTHHTGDLNIDHAIAHRAVVTAFRPQPGESFEAVYAFEVPSSTEWQSPGGGLAFVPDHFVEITPYLDRKLGALACYPGEMREFPHARSIAAVEAMARLAGSQAGVPAAERFVTIRRIRRLDGSADA